MKGKIIGKFSKMSFKKFVDEFGPLIYAGYEAYKEFSSKDSSAPVIEYVQDDEMINKQKNIILGLFILVSMFICYYWIYPMFKRHDKPKEIQEKQ